MNTDYNLQSSGLGGGGFGWGGFGSGIGGLGLVGLVGINNLFDRDRKDCGDGGGIFAATVLNKLGDIQNEVPSTAAATQATVAATGASLKDTIQNQTLFQSQAFGNLKDSVQLGFAGVLSQGAQTQNIVQEVGCSIKQAIDAEGDSIKALINDIRREQLQTELLELRAEHRGLRGEINISQTVNQAQAQAQQQQQQQAVNDKLNNLHWFLNNQFQFQNARTGASSIQFGTGNLAANTPTTNAQQVG